MRLAPGSDCDLTDEPIRIELSMIWPLCSVTPGIRLEGQNCRAEFPDWFESYATITGRRAKRGDRILCER